MLKKSKVRSASRTADDRRNKSKPSGNVYVSPSFIRKFERFAAKKQESKTTKISRDDRVSSKLPRDAAVHFGSFYGVRESANKSESTKSRSNLPIPNEPSLNGTCPKSEFTRQMVHKLERTAGTEEYARQVSALLEETVEPAHFRLHSLPTENSIPDGRQNPSGFPLWYRDPFKMPFASDEIYKLLREKYDDVRKGKDIFEDDSSENDSCRLSNQEEERDEDESSYVADETNAIERESISNILASRSTSGTEAKDTNSTESTNISVDETANKKTEVTD